MVGATGAKEGARVAARSRVSVRVTSYATGRRSRPLALRTSQKQAQNENPTVVYVFSILK